jgi:NAD-dependent DNA ligase
MYKTLDDRYYVPKVSAKNKIGEMFARKVLEAIKVTKHERVRRNPKEKAKLDYLDSELRTSPRLKDIPMETEHFESQTSQEFTISITQHMASMRRDEAQAKIVQRERFVRDASQASSGPTFRVHPVLSPHRMGLSVSPSEIKQKV